MKKKSNFSLFLTPRSVSVLFALGTLLVPWDFSQVQAQSGAGSVVSYEGYGEARAEQGVDLSGARAQAFDNALLDAFQKALRDLCPADTPLEVQEKAIESLAPEVKSFLLRYRIVSEMPTQGAFFLTVEASFSSKAVKEALARTLVDGTQAPKRGSSGTVTVRASGITSHGLYRELVAFLRSRVPGIRSVLLEEVFGTQALLRLEADGDPESLAALLLQWEPEGFSLRVESGAGELALFLCPSPTGEPSDGSGQSEDSP